MDGYKVPLLALTRAMLNALAEGVSRLEDGDPSNIWDAREVRVAMLKEHGLILSGGSWVSQSEASFGYARVPERDEPVMVSRSHGVWAWHRDGDGHRGAEHVEVPRDTTIYFDSKCTVPLLITT